MTGTDARKKEGAGNYFGILVSIFKNKKYFCVSHSENNTTYSNAEGIGPPVRSYTLC